MITTSVPQAFFFSELPLGGQAKKLEAREKTGHSVQFYMMH